jgi:hypothetical protein
MIALPVKRQRRIPSETWVTWLAWLVAPGSLALFDRLCAWGSPLCDDAPLPTAGFVLLATHALGGAITFGLLLQYTMGLLLFERIIDKHSEPSDAQKNSERRRPEFWLLLCYWGALAWYFAGHDLPFRCLVTLAWAGLAASLASALWLSCTSIRGQLDG